ncbi:MAG: hypothetical protein DMD26_17815 [Gemmatimonadetes bacterium]|nr:MAG: hypothetical protein DMD26_17815 [Gemmatimonadota bacterium]
MSLLAPLYLLLGAAALVPLLIHLLRRRIGTRIDFPAARYLARAEQEHSRSLRLRNILLMLLRVAIVLFVASAAARPVIRLAGAGHGPTALAIVLDNSLSTTVVVDGHPLFEQFRGTHAGAAVRSGGLDSRQIILLTDGQRTAWTQNVDVGDVQVVLWLPGGTPPANHAVVSADARPDRWTPRGAVVARLMSKDSTTYRITLGGRSIVRGTAAPGEEVVIRAAPPERGWLAGTIELEPDELPGDNVRHFAVWIGAPPGVSVAPSAGAFARSAVDVLKGSGRVVEGRDIAVVSADELTSLPALILAPSDPVRLGAANRALERAAVPWRFGAAHHGETSVTSAHRPSSASDSAQSGSFVDVSATVRYELMAQGGADADTIARIGREPWIVIGPRYAIVASPLDPTATSFPVRAAFVPWLATVLTERLVGEPGGTIEASPGQPLARPRWADAIEDLSGARSTFGDDLQAPSRAGTYFLERAGRRVGALVVNPEPNESVLDRLTGSDVARRIHARQVLTAPDRPQLANLSFRSAARRSISEPLLFAALALLIIEGLLVGTRRRAAPAAAA